MRAVSALAAVVVVFGACAATAQPPIALSLVAPDVPVDQSPIAAVTADFNGDGKVDLAVANNDSDDVSVLWGNGDGTFLDSGATFGVGMAPSAIAVGDFNNDGMLDIVTANEVDFTVSVLLGSGGTTFGEAQTTDTGASPEAVVVGDFDGDGKLDVLTANNFDCTVTVLRGVGDGTFTLSQTIPVGLEPQAAIGVDVDGDGRLDVVVVNSSGGPDENGSVTILKGLEGGVFDPEPEITSTGFDFPVAVTAADLNNDHKVDLIVVNEEGDSVSVLLGNGDGTFLSPINVSTGPDGVPEGAVAVDLNGDGNIDIATSRNFDDKVAVLAGNGDGTFQPVETFDVGAGPYGIVAANFNGDSLVDLATTNMEDDTVSILLNITGSAPPPTPTPGVLCAGDCNGDHTVDVTEIITLVNIALGTTPVMACTAGDVNGDMMIDVTEIIAAVNDALNGCP
jgi:hypothetical protein